MAISCNCEVVPRVYNYGNSAPEVPVGDLRKRIEDEEYLNDRTIGQMDLPVCESIGKRAFEGSSVTGVYAPSCVTVDDRAFYNCDKLSDVDLSSATSIGSSAFYGAHVETSGSVYWDFSGVSVIKDDAFRNLEIGSTTNFNIDFSSVQEIGSSAFAMTNRWPKIEQSFELILPNCTKIGAEAFKGSWSSYGEWQKHFSLISLPRIETIGDGAFNIIGEVNNNIEIHFGPYCTTIGEMIFDDWGCEHAKLYVHAINPPTLQGYLVSIFDYDTPFRPPMIYVPAQSVNAYKTAPYWSAYASRIEAMPEGTVIPT